MTGIPEDVKDISREQTVALLEKTLDLALAGKLEFLCLTYQVGNEIKGHWLGIDTAQKTVDATKGLDALRNAILQVKTKAL